MKKLKKEKWQKIGVVNTEIDFIPDFVVYTDGSCNNFSMFGEGGASYIVLDCGNNIVKVASKGVLGSTNNRVEMLAILSALQTLPDGSSVIIRTDSQYCINAFSKRVTRFSLGVKNQDIISMYEVESKRFAKIVFQWVKSHNGDYFNEMADVLSNERRNEIQTLYRIPNSSYNRMKRKEWNEVVSRFNKMEQWLGTPASKGYHDTEPF